MLFEFHRSENAKKPKSVNATYLISGVQPVQAKKTSNGAHIKDGEDEIMQSSPFMSSQPEHHEEPKPTTRTMSIILARQEDLIGKPFYTLKREREREISKRIQ